MEISHIVTNGCSWTYCQGLDDPATQGWPAILAKKLGVPCVNIAVPGCGNESINRRNHEYVYQNLSTNSKPFFIVGWSQYWRADAWFKIYSGIKPYNDYGSVNLNPVAEKHETYLRGMLENWDDEHSLRKTLLSKLSTINLFKAHNIPFIHSDWSADIELFTNHGVMDTIINKLPFIKEMLDKSTVNSTDTTMNVLCGIYPKLPCGHENVESNLNIGEYLYEQITKQYTDIQIVESEYIDRKAFGVNKAESRSHKHWV